MIPFFTTSKDTEIVHIQIVSFLFSFIQKAVLFDCIIRAAVRWNAQHNI